ncbi:MAG: gfo/Idh/MocA family oxidoreductase [Candidatus Latescibacterota bacterium]|nr:MAG: gfo/Idh/MocA family oxidoreductase [Candidatus Latescibacterota bacterium]
MEKVRVGMVGAGSMANAVHYPSLAEIDDAEIVAICDINEERLHSTADKYGVDLRYTDYRRMVEEADPDAVYVIMPPHHLFDIVIWLLEQGKHVFIEKPPGVSRFQTESMARAAERNACITMVGFNRRFIPLLVKAKERVETHGPVLQAVATFYKNLVGAESYPYYGGAVDILTCDAVHAVDTLRWMCGGEVVSVVSDVRRFSAPWENAFFALVRFSSGATGVLLTNWAAGKRVHTFEMHSLGISAFVDGNSQAVIYEDNEEEPAEVWDVKDVAGSGEFYKFYGFFDENRHFIECVREGREPITSFGDAVKTMELVEMIYRAGT